MSHNRIIMKGKENKSDNKKDNETEIKATPTAFKLEFESEEIFVSGPQSQVEGLRKVLNEDGQQRIDPQHYHNYTVTINSVPHQCARFNFSVLMLARRIIGNGSVAHNILRYVRELGATGTTIISRRDMRLLGYYDYEATLLDKRRPWNSYGRPLMIEFAVDTQNFSENEGSMYEIQRLMAFVISLTPPPEIDKFFNQVDLVPSKMQLFPAEETLISLRKFSERFPTLSPFQIINEFFNQANESTCQIRSAAHLVKQGHGKNQNSFFATLPDDLCMKIASYTGNPLIHSEDMAGDIANEVFGRERYTRNNK